MNSTFINQMRNDYRAIVIYYFITLLSIQYIKTVECRLNHKSSVGGFVFDHRRTKGTHRAEPFVPHLINAIIEKNSISVEQTNHELQTIPNRRLFLSSCAFMSMSVMPYKSVGEDAVSTAAFSDVQVVPRGDVKTLFNEGRAFESQGNVLAAQRVYTKVTKLSPRFIYGWSSLGNTLVTQGELNAADETYTNAISLCEENLKAGEKSFGTYRCDDLYLLLLNRGSVRLNNGRAKEALVDLERSNALRARPDAIVLQNLARAQELNGQYSLSDKSYSTAISMTANEVSPFWLRSAMVKYQLNDLSGAMDLLRRVDNRFPEAPEVRAAYAVFLLAKGEEDSARKKFLEIPDRQRLKYTDEQYLNDVIAWPPIMKKGAVLLARLVGDSD